MSENQTLQDTPVTPPPVLQDTPVSDADKIATDLGGTPPQQSGNVLDLTEDQRAHGLMRDDYLKKLDALKKEREELERLKSESKGSGIDLDNLTPEQAAKLRAALAQGEQAQGQSETPQKVNLDELKPQTDWFGMMDVGETPEQFESDVEELLWKRTRGLEVLLDRLYQQQVQMSQYIQQMGTTQQGAYEQYYVSQVNTASAQMKEKYGIEVEPKEVHEAFAALAQPLGLQDPTPDNLIKAYMAKNHSAGTVPQPRTEQKKPTPPAMPSGGSSRPPATGNTDEDRILADLLGN